MINNMPQTDYYRIFTGEQLVIAKYSQLIANMIDQINRNAKLTTVEEGSGAPTHTANKHAWYFDTAASKYYRNTDGGTTWVALN